MVPKLPGHSIRVGLNKPGERYLAVCECGYRSATKISEAVALGSAVHHLRKVAAQLRADGVSTRSLHRSA